MITQIAPNGIKKLIWMMCNTNGPYPFSNPPAMAVFGPTCGSSMRAGPGDRRVTP